LCTKHSNSNEFFIRKAIGWALREYAKTDPNAVRNFVNKTNLKPLSKKEALKNI
jgi:3-methyladenine DNA glycosylase AlkD